MFVGRERELETLEGYYAQPGFNFTDLGRWWGSNPALRREEEIDIMAYNGDEQSAIFGECKWRNAKTGVDVFADLVRKSELFHQFK
ncbi:MAG: DUF234 domain-containing protein, partial [Spirochaetaceae bacterium]|nr:DUF234 domain-containing protein [Spirochaetaceae bacterium]